MRAREFLKEFTVNVPVTINIPLSDILQSKTDDQVINPGLRYGEDGDAKWSPPLQQTLDTMKDSVGPSQTDPTQIHDQDTHHEPQLNQKVAPAAAPRRTPSAVIFNKTPSMP